MNNDSLQLSCSHKGDVIGKLSVAKDMLARDNSTLSPTYGWGDTCHLQPYVAKIGGTGRSL